MRQRIIERILLAASFAGCGNDLSAIDDEEQTVGPGGPYTQTTEECFAWPQPVGGAGGVAGAGGTGGLGGSGGLAGAGGLGGSAGPGGGGSEVTCPDRIEAAVFIPDQACGRTVDTDGTLKNGQCCYTVTLTYCAGRPFIVDGLSRVAEARRGARDWIDDRLPAPSMHGLEPEERAALAEAWCRDGMFEHASVASFGRFALELMAVGAPADLLAAAHEAALDEVRHARACLWLASAYAGGPIRPAAFPLGGAVEVSADLADLAARVAREGCVGETVAALTAHAQLTEARDPAVQRILAMIADDEARHAELAWRTVAWAIQTGGEAVRSRVAQALQNAIVDIAAAPIDAHELPSPRLAAHGRLDAALARRVRQAALTDAVQPAAQQLS